MGMRTRTAAMVVLVVALAIAGLTGCSGDTEDDTVSAGGGSTTDASDPGPEEPGEGEDPGDQPALPEGEPTVTGVIVSGDAGPELTEVEGATANDDAYYSGAIVLLTGSETIVDADGEPATLGEVLTLPVEVWFDACRETFPVQCDLIAVRVLGDGQAPEGDPDLLETDPDVRGEVLSTDAGSQLRLAEGEDEYYSGAWLTFTVDTVYMDGSTGEALGIDDIFDVPVELWLDGCDESFPVQCGVRAVRVVG